MNSFAPGLRPSVAARHGGLGRKRPYGETLALGLTALVLAGLWSCKRLPAEPPPVAAPAAPSATAQFEEVSARLGLDFVHTHGGCGAKLFVEQLGSGCAFLDYDNDGWQDILLLRCAPLPGCPASPIPGSSMVLYRNEQGRRFRDVTRQAGLNIFGSALGCSVADYDNDGYPDIYVTGYGRNWLFRNTGDRGQGPGARESSERAPVFQDVTSRAGIAVGGMSTSSAWLDFDGDGWLDLYVCRYVRWTPARDLRCDSLGQRAYCPPDHYPAETNRLFRNNRDGTFTDVTARAGVAGEGGRSLGVVIADVEDDNRPDIFVANDRSPNFLFRNRADGTFADLSAPAGIALPDTARPKAGMGVDLIDLDGSGLPGIIIGNFNYESLTLFHNTGRGYFQDVTFPRGLGEPSHPFLTWSVFSFDYDLDGVSDLFAANGHIQDNIAQVSPDVAYAERPLLFRGDGTGAFIETGALCGLAQPLTARGAAWGDFDNDGRPDILINNIHERARLYRNVAVGPPGNWLKLRLRGTTSNRLGIGAKITVESAGRRQVNWIRSGSGYCSASDLRPNFGLGNTATAARVTIRWPSGRTQDLERVAANQLLEVTEPKP